MSNIQFQCQDCNHVYGAVFPSQPLVQLHRTVSHGATEYVYAV